MQKSKPKALPDGRHSGPAMRAASCLIATLFLAMAAPACAGWKKARCLITQDGPSYSGPCLFQAERGGTFSIKPAKPYRTMLGATNVSVAMTGMGEAEVRGLTDKGINSRWGMVKRSRRDPACWEGEGFTICAW